MPSIVYKGKQEIIGGGGGTWTPAELSLAVWLDASSPSNFELVGNKVSQWYDLSGNNRHAVQSTDSARPLYASEQFVIFDGANDGLTISNSYSVSSRSAVNKVSFFVVLRSSATDSTYRAIFSCDGSVGGYQRGAGVVSTSIYAQGGSDSNSMVNTTNPLGFYLLSVEYDYPVNYFLGVNGTISAKGTGETGAGTAGLPLALGWGFPLSTFGGSQNFIGDMTDFIVIEGILTEINRTKLEGYLAHKRGFTSYLPVSHPYKNSPP